MLLPVVEANSRNRDAAVAGASWPVPSGALEQAIPTEPNGPQPTPAPTQDPCAGRQPTGDYALITFLSLERYGYKGVAVDGNWDLLRRHPMVHHHDSSAPGERGNAVFAFHREPAYEHIDQLQVDDLVSVQDRNCYVFTYRINKRLEAPPSRVDELGPTHGYDLTLITCTPWYRDYNRLIWTADLVAIEVIAS
jgi:LPXTG-site transpeptidase (sortase) family protein